MKTIIYLVRHAEANSNINPLELDGENNGLTEEGKKQAEKAAAKLGTKPIDLLYTSHILRAIETGAEISKTTGKNPEILKCIKERVGFYAEDLVFQPTESFEDFKIRHAELKDFVENLTVERAVFVSHAGFIKSFIGFVMFGDLYNEDLWKKVNSSYIIDNGSITELVYNHEKKNWKVRKVNG